MVRSAQQEQTYTMPFGKAQALVLALQETGMPEGIARALQRADGGVLVLRGSAAEVHAAQALVLACLAFAQYVETNAVYNVLAHLGIVAMPDTDQG